MDLTPDVHVHIEELVLNGFDPSDRYAIGEAVERELVRLLGMRGFPPSLLAGGQVPRLDGGSFALAPGLGAEEIGARVAAATYGALRP
jgi:hypothetical protein